MTSPSPSTSRSSRSSLGDEAVTWLRLQKRAHQEFGARVALVSDWAAPTPDRDWDTADLVRHVIEEQQWVPWLLSGLTTKQAKSRLHRLGENLAEEWHRYSLAATTAWHDASPEQPVNLSYDTVEVIDYLKEQVADVTIHTWDLARAVGAEETLDEELIAAVWTVFEPQRDTLEASGLFASPVPVGEDAPLQSRLLALTGRDDRVPA